MRAMLIPSKFVDHPKKREKHLETIKMIRDMVSPECTIKDAEREKHLADVSYVTNTVRRR